jgi:hypothetical protein
MASAGRRRLVAPMLSKNIYTPKKIERKKIKKEKKKKKKEKGSFIFENNTGSISRSIPNFTPRRAHLRRMRLQNVRLKNLSFLAKSKIGIFACFFRANLTVLGVLVGSAGE